MIGGDDCLLGDDYLLSYNDIDPYHIHFDEKTKVRSFKHRGVLMRTEYASGHDWYGETRFYNEGKHERTEYASGHPRHHEIRHFNDKCLTHTTYALGHPRAGKCDYPEFDQCVDGDDDADDTSVVDGGSDEESAGNAASPGAWRRGKT